MQAKNIVIAVLALVLLGSVGYLLLNSGDNVVIVESEPKEDMIPVEPDNGIGDGAEALDEVMVAERGDESVIGTSVDGNPVTAYHFGNGETEILLIGGIHGGYSWNTAVLGYELVDYFDANLGLIPDDITVTVIPVMNPDGLKTTVGTVGRFNSADALAVNETTRIDGRFNENTVDLNRNFDCEWKETGTWKNQSVSGGSAPFSEPEAAAIRDYVNTNNPAAAVVWFSSEGKVYPSACGTNPSGQSVELAATFATAAGYTAEAEFDAYAITGDMVNWFADQNIAAISVLLTDHKNSEMDKNLAGVKAVLKAYSK
ncbi:MAG: M14 family metallopeptidase [Candidatus Pacebacteria bacterium]|nr:M14 family metallopeptidase [Candidatus Paceibacterota bacterium]